MSLPGYADYYARIAQKAHSGFKPVPGGTGLGKTRGVADFVADDRLERKVIYVANRVQLLGEMATALEARGVGYVHVRRDSDALLGGVSDGLEAFARLLGSKEVQRVCSEAEDLPDPAVPLRLCHDLARLRQLPYAELFEELAGHRVSAVMRFFKDLMRAASERARTDPSAVAAYQTLRARPVLRQLFPYLTFAEEPDKRVLLITLQKLYHGVFDGQQMLTVARLQKEHGDRVVFLDEFDFLEANLTDLICRDAEVDAPFAFVAHFYNAMKRHKLPLPDYPKHPGIRRRIERVIATVERLPERGLDFPSVNQFICETPELKNTALFQTTRTLVTRPVFLKPNGRAFELWPASGEDDPEKSSAFRLFNTVRAATDQILYLFKELEATDQALRDELLRHCFAHTTFSDTVRRLKQLPQPGRAQLSRFDKLLDAGYGLFELRDLRQRSDPSEVALTHYAMHTTPERILYALAKDNLVFGLSATADLPRVVQGFSDAWLRRQDLAYLEVDDEDRATVEALNEAKQTARGNAVRVERAADLDPDVPSEKQLIAFLKAVADDEGFGGDNPYRRGRVERFFATLEWIVRERADHPDDTHLVFLSSFRQPEHVLVHYPRPDGLPWRVERLTSPPGAAGRVFHYYELIYRERPLTVVFYDARQAQQLGEAKALGEHYQSLFWQRRPVVVVTTYPSAGNGVNLQYKPDPESEEQDFVNLHLLDSPYYYFNRLEPGMDPAERRAAVKANLWYLAKLFEAKLLSEAQFKTYLSNARHDLLSARYLEGSTAQDALLNRLATFIQAMGRVERVWRKVPNQTIRLSREVFDVFATFQTEDAYADLRESRAALNSGNLKQVFGQIAEQACQEGQQREQTRDERLSSWDARSRRAIEDLVTRFHVEETRRDWLELRQAVLKHDFAAEIFRRYPCVFSSPYLKAGKLWLQGNDLLPPGSSGPDVRVWDLDLAYAPVRQNEILRYHFEVRGFELTFDHPTRQAFTPYTFQAILLGAVGEEAIRALYEAHDVHLEPVSDGLFEVADFKLQHLPWYIDAKNYGERTLERFGLPLTDSESHPQLNEATLLQKCQRKLGALGPEAKLIVCNLLGSIERPIRYYTREGEPADRLGAAHIVIVPGALSQEEPAQPAAPFLALADAIRAEQLRATMEKTRV